MERSLSSTSWQVLQASVAGTAHQEVGLPCQDSHASQVLVPPSAGKTDTLLLVTADGAGSAEHSAQGATLACQETLRWLTEQLSTCLSLEQLSGPDLLHFLRAGLESLAENEGWVLRDLACTLNVAVIQTEEAWFMQVGDGTTVIQAPEGELQVVFWPDNGEYANQTFFITDVAENHLHLHHQQGALKRVALLTDGLVPLALQLQQRRAHLPFFEAMFRSLETVPLGPPATEKSRELSALQSGLEQFLASAAVNARTNDDKTLVLAARVLVSP